MDKTAKWYCLERIKACMDLMKDIAGRLNRLVDKEDITWLDANDVALVVSDLTEVRKEVERIVP